MELVLIGLAATIGLCVGSFLNVVIVRLGSGESFLFGRSHCQRCERQLSVVELIPIVSFVVLRGRCRSCKERISWQYPVVELLSAALFGFFVYRVLSGEDVLTLPLLAVEILALTVLAGLIIIAVYDIRHYIIPDKVLLPLIALAIVYQLLRGDDVLFSFLAAFSGALLFFLLFWFSKGEWMGFGDVKFVFFMGLFLGVGGLALALFCAFVSGAIIGVVLLLVHRRNIGEHIPFAPFLILGTATSFFWGEPLISWYLRLALG